MKRREPTSVQRLVGSGPPLKLFSLSPRKSRRRSRSTSALDDQWPLDHLNLLNRTGFVLEIHGRGRRRRGYGVLVDDLLMTIAVEEHAESVKSCNDPLQPYAIAQKNRDRRSFPLQMLEEGILKTMNVVLCHLCKS